jgi:hypothetical protein
VQRLVTETAALTRIASYRLVTGLGLVLATIGLHLIVRPTTEDVFAALAIWLPGVVGLVMIVFSAVPDLVELVRYRFLVVEPAKTFTATGSTPAVEPAPAVDGDDATP